MRPWRGNLTIHVSIEEIMGRFHGMARFTITDFNKGYWMVELDPESRKIHNNGLGHWKVSVDLTSNGFHCGHKMSFKGNWMQSSLAFQEPQE